MAKTTKQTKAAKTELESANGPDIKSFQRKAVERSEAPDGVKFMLDDTEFETIVSTLPLGLSLEYSGWSAMSAGQQSAMTMKFFLAVLGEDQFNTLVTMLNEPDFETEDNFVAELNLFIMGEFSGRFSEEG